MESYNWEQLPITSEMGWREASDQDRTAWSPGFAQILTPVQFSAHRAEAVPQGPELPHLLPEEKEELCPVEDDPGTAAHSLPSGDHSMMGWKGP